MEGDNSFFQSFWKPSNSVLVSSSNRNGFPSSVFLLNEAAVFAKPETNGQYTLSTPGKSRSPVRFVGTVAHLMATILRLSTSN